MEVKICGLRAAADADAARTAGADFAGLNFVPSSRRRVDLELARDLVARLGDVHAVGVFRDQPLAEVQTIAAAVGLRWVQLHGAESPADCATLQAAGLSVIKALAVDGAFQAEDTVAFAACDRLLLDGPTPGSGQRLPPDAVAGVRVPFFLAGGLTPENVAAAIAAVRPAGVDAASGVETDGQIDPARVAAFCRHAKEHP